MHQNGNACDYVSDGVIQQASMKNGNMHYGPRKYHTLFMVNVQRMQPATLKKLYEFTSSGGRIFCIENYPEKSLGCNNHQKHDQEVQGWVAKLKAQPKQFILLSRPETNVIQWYKDIQVKYGIMPYVNINQPNHFVTQVRYQASGAEILLFINSDTQNAHPIIVKASNAITSGRRAWLWDAETGERSRLDTKDGSLTLNLGPADSRLIVYDNQLDGKVLQLKPLSKAGQLNVSKWTAQFNHIDGSTKSAQLNGLKDLKSMPEHVNFAGNVTYRSQVTVNNAATIQYINLGTAYGTTELFINGKPAGIQWYGRRVFPVQGMLVNGANTIEVKVATSMGNYLKTLVDNPIAQKWTNSVKRPQPIQSMGLVGPVTLY